MHPTGPGCRGALCPPHCEEPQGVGGKGPSVPPLPKPGVALGAAHYTPEAVPRAVRPPSQGSGKGLNSSQTRGCTVSLLISEHIHPGLPHPAFDLRAGSSRVGPAALPLPPVRSSRKWKAALVQSRAFQENGSHVTSQHLETLGPTVLPQAGAGPLLGAGGPETQWGGSDYPTSPPPSSRRSLFPTPPPALPGVPQDQRR